ncbi:hypothetical protein CHELA41_51361 [Hyphomicrobiales bacterium]|nr:hypothetical protein CHELA41_51361 [Hyphomicrobiales bacterium]
MRSASALGNGYCRDPYALSKTIAEKLFAAGARFIRADVAGFAITKGRLAAVRIYQGDLPATSRRRRGRLVEDTAASLGHAVPMESQRGHHDTVRNAPISRSAPCSASAIAS